MRKEDINIGRYYNTPTGRGGKFGFGCQNSTDPEDYFGMAPTMITYQTDNKEYIRRKLNDIYKKAGVPQEERIYKLDGSDHEYDDFEMRYHRYFFRDKSTGDEGKTPFAGSNGRTEVEAFTNAHLWSSRLWLGLVISSDIEDDGYCEIDAEL